MISVLVRMSVQSNLQRVFKMSGTHALSVARQWSMDASMTSTVVQRLADDFVVDSNPRLVDALLHAQTS